MCASNLSIRRVIQERIRYYTIASGKCIDIFSNEILDTHTVQAIEEIYAAAMKKAIHSSANVCKSCLIHSLIEL